MLQEGLQRYSIGPLSLVSDIILGVSETLSGHHRDHLRLSVGLDVMTNQPYALRHNLIRRS